MAVPIERILTITGQESRWHFGTEQIRKLVRELVKEEKFPADIAPDSIDNGDRLTPPYIHPQFTLDRERYCLIVDGDIVRLSWTEYRLIAELARYTNRVITKELLIENIWGAEGGEANVRLYVSYVRKKIDHGRKIQSPIEALFGIGYILRDPSRLIVE